MVAHMLAVVIFYSCLQMDASPEALIHCMHDSELQQRLK